MRVAEPRAADLFVSRLVTTRTTTFRELEGTIIDWSWFSHKKTGKIPFLIREDILESDEAIVAVIGRRGTTG